MDGGRILKTVKTSYAEHLADEKMGEIVRKMMKDQHKAMFMALRDGAFDAQINHITPGLGVAPGDPAAVPPATPSAAIEAPPASIAQPEPPRASPMVAAPPVAEPPPSRSVPFVPEPMPRPPALPAEATAVAAQVPVSLPRVPTSPGQVFVRRTPSVMLAPGVEARPAELPVEGSWGDEPAPRYSRTPSPVSTPRATTEPPAVPPSQPPRASRPPSITPFPASDLPPPPAAVLGKHRPQGGAYSEVSALAKPSGPEKHSSGRYLASRPTSQAATSRPPDGRSLFGDDLISEKSLDEVILSYLAEDLDTPPPKK